MRSGKVWGVTQMLEANPMLELHRIEIDAGGVCSRHRHQFKWNGFFVESGRLLIRAWKNDYDLVDETQLGPGDYTRIPPGEYHQFEALEPTVAFEIYWAQLDHGDIQRDTQGFMRDQ